MLIALGMLALAGCQNMPPPYAPPEQFTFPEQVRNHKVERMVEISDKDSGDYFVADILGKPGDPWAWTGKRPMVKLKPPRTPEVRYVMDLAIAGATFDSTGPVTITFLVNGQALDSIRYTKAGAYHFEKVVPPAWVVEAAEVQAGAEIDKMWTSPDQSSHLGFILTRVGLIGQ